MSNILVFGVVSFFVAFIINIVMIVHGFKKSVGSGLFCLFIPFGSIVFAFKDFYAPYKKIIVSVFIFAIIGFMVCSSFVAYSTFAEDTTEEKKEKQKIIKQGNDEFDKQINELNNLQEEDMQLDL